MSTSCRLRRKSKFVWLNESKMRIRKIVGKSPIIYDINQIIDDFTAQLKLFLVFFFSIKTCYYCLQAIYYVLLINNRQI